jgi:hypothetical protein
MCASTQCCRFCTAECSHICYTVAPSGSTLCNCCRPPWPVQQVAGPAVQRLHCRLHLKWLCVPRRSAPHTPLLLPQQCHFQQRSPPKQLLRLLVARRSLHTGTMMIYGQNREHKHTTSRRLLELLPALEIAAALNDVGKPSLLGKHSLRRPRPSCGSAKDRTCKQNSRHQLPLTAPLSIYCTGGRQTASAIGVVTPEPPTPPYIADKWLTEGCCEFTCRLSSAAAVHHDRLLVPPQGAPTGHDGRHACAAHSTS